MTPKNEDPFQLFDDTSIKKEKTQKIEETQDRISQRERVKKLTEEAEIGLTAQIKKDLDNKKRRKQKINQIYENSDIGLTAKIRMGIENVLEEDDDNIADKYGYGDESKNTKPNKRNVWDDYLSPTAKIKKNLSEKWQSEESLGLTEKIARSLLVRKSETNEIETKANVFWDIVILGSGIIATVFLAIFIIYIINAISQ